MNSSNWRSYMPPHLEKHFLALLKAQESATVHFTPPVVGVEPPDDGATTLAVKVTSMDCIGPKRAVVEQDSVDLLATLGAPPVVFDAPQRPRQLVTECVPVVEVPQVLTEERGIAWDD